MQNGRSAKLAILSKAFVSVAACIYFLLPQTILAGTTQENLLLDQNSYEVLKGTGCQAQKTTGIGPAIVNTFASIMGDYENPLLPGDRKAILPSNLINHVGCMYDTGQGAKITTAISSIFGPGHTVDAPYAMIDSLYTSPPGSAIIYAGEMLNKVTQPGKVYAAGEAPPYFPGLGYNAYAAIRPIWGTVVNFVYSIMIILVLVVAFGLLFQGFGGKATVTLSAAIPNIVIAMVLIPLSYPISAFAIDFLALGSNLAHGILLSGPNAIGNQKYDGGEGLVKTQIGIGGGLFDKVLNALVPPAPTPSGGSGTCTGENAAGGTLSQFNNQCNRGFYVDDPRVSVLRAFTLLDIGDMTEFLRNNVIEDTVARNYTYTLAWICANGQLPPTPAPAAPQPLNLPAAGPGAKGGLACTIQQISTQISNFFTGTLNFSGVGSFIADIISLLLSYFMFFTGLLLFIKLLFKYITLLLFPIISPIVFASIALPGTGTKMVTWYLRSLYGSALFYILTYVLIIVIVLLSQDGLITPENAQLINKDSYIPPLLGITNNSILSAPASLLINPGINISIQGILDGVALALFFALPKILAEAEKWLQLNFKLPEQLQYVTAGFQASRGLAGLTVRGAADAGRTAVELPRRTIQNRVRLLDTRSPLGEKGLIEKRKEAAQENARKLAFAKESRSGLTRLQANTIGQATTTVKNRALLAGTGIDAGAVVPKIAESINWQFISGDNIGNPSNIIIRKRTLGSSTRYLNNVEFSVDKEAGNRIYGEAVFMNNKGAVPSDRNKIRLQARGNPSIKAVLIVDNGSSFIDFNNNGKGSPSPILRTYEILFESGSPEPGQVFEPTNLPLYSLWYRPTPQRPQAENGRPLTITIQ